MAIETVHVYCYDQDTPANLVDGVLVRVYSGASFVTQGYTGDDGTGIVEFGLDGSVSGTTYTIRMSKVGVAFDSSLGDEYKSPQSISIYSPPSGSPTGTNDFEVYCEVFTYPSASDPRLCRCSGYFYSPDGTPRAGENIVFINQFNPTIVDGYGIVGSRVTETIDDDGYVSVDLYRSGRYDVTMGDLGELKREIVVPNLNGQNLVYMLFPQVISITYSPASVTVAENDYEDVDVTVICTDGRTLENSGEDVEYTSSDEAVTSAGIVDGKLRVYGNSVGSATISGTQVDDSVTTIPEITITQTPLAVTVS